MCKKFDTRYFICAKNGNKITGIEQQQCIVSRAFYLLSRTAPQQQIPTISSLCRFQSTNISNPKAELSGKVWNVNIPWIGADCASKKKRVPSTKERTRTIVLQKSMLLFYAFHVVACSRIDANKIIYVNKKRNGNLCAGFDCCWL